MKIIRVFPHKTNATPTDELARHGMGGPGFWDEADEVHISVAFTWDLPAAELLVQMWSVVAPVKVGGPATGQPGDGFTPGMYLKPGYVVTSRGCPNHCWFCSVWKREGDVRTLPICDGWNVLDDNLLACPEAHIRTVFAMLARQPQRPQFTGGLEAARLERWHAEALRELRPKQLFFAYDTPEGLEPLRAAGKLLLDVGFTRASHALRCYVLCGYPRDTFGDAERRMREALDAGFTPMAMLWRDDDGKRDRKWIRFQKVWARPAIIHTKKERRRCPEEC